MKAHLVDILACPVCAGRLELSPTAESDTAGEILNGELDCNRCPRRYAIRDGVPRLLPPNLSVTERRTSAAFGWQWREFTEMHEEYEEQFLDWIAPLKPEFFRGKLVLDAGCGMGRHAYYAARYGASEVVAMDLSDAVSTAFANLSGLPNVHVVQGDIHHPPFMRADGTGPFDFIYSIGVLHHLPDPAAGFASLVRYVRPGGMVFAWVYGKENNGVARGFVGPLRTVSTRLPPPILTLVAWPLAVTMQAALKGVYRPLHGTKLFSILPSRDYLYSISGFNFRRNYNIVFDQLVAPVAVHLTRDEFENWFRVMRLEDVRISWRNRNSWRGIGRVPQQTPIAERPAPAAHSHHKSRT